MLLCHQIIANAPLPADFWICESYFQTDVVHHRVPHCWVDNLRHIHLYIPMLAYQVRLDRCEASTLDLPANSVWCYWSDKHSFEFGCINPSHATGMETQYGQI